MEEIIKRLESLRDICNARSDMFVGDAKIVWAGYGKTVSDALAMMKEQEAVYPSWQNGKMYCGHCGSKFPPRVGMRFCHRCGVPIKLKVNDIVEQEGR